MIQYQQWVLERKRRRIILLNEVRSDFAKKPKAEQEHQLKQFDTLGYSMEDVVDQVLDKQEQEWRQSLRDTQSQSLSQDVGNNSESENTKSEETEIGKETTNSDRLRAHRR